MEQIEACMCFSFTFSLLPFSLHREATETTSFWCVVPLLPCAKPVAPHREGIEAWVSYLLFSLSDNPCCFRWFGLVAFLHISWTRWQWCCILLTQTLEWVRVVGSGCVCFWMACYASGISSLIRFVDIGEKKKKSPSSFPSFLADHVWLGCFIKLWDGTHHAFADFELAFWPKWVLIDAHC